MNKPLVILSRALRVFESGAPASFRTVSRRLRGITDTRLVLACSHCITPRRCEQRRRCARLLRPCGPPPCVPWDARSVQADSHTRPAPRRVTTNSHAQARYRRCRRQGQALPDPRGLQRAAGQEGPDGHHQHAAVRAPNRRAASCHSSARRAAAPSRVAQPWASPSCCDASAAVHTNGSSELLRLLLATARVSYARFSPGRIFQD